jgi:hypothetical protein
MKKLKWKKKKGGVKFRLLFGGHYAKKFQQVDHAMARGGHGSMAPLKNWQGFVAFYGRVWKRGSIRVFKNLKFFFIKI